MSPEIQEWSHKSRSRINNLYLLTRPIKDQMSGHENAGPDVEGPSKNAASLCN